MKIINLDTKNYEQELIKKHLQENASDSLIDKINNGVLIEKDGKRLLNKKDFESFMNYACEQARKEYANGNNSACVIETVVYGWAMHYFQEDTIIGTLYNEDGSKYRSTIKSKPVITETKVQKKQEESKPTLFDFIQTPKAIEKEAEEEIEPERLSEQEIKLQNGIYKRFFINKQKNLQSIVFVKLGDFYETFDEDAAYVSEILELTLINKTFTSDIKVPMCGIPYHAIEVYISKITEHKNVVLVDSDIDIKIYNCNQTSYVDAETGVVVEFDEMEQFDGDIEETLSIREEQPQIEFIKYLQELLGKEVVFIGEDYEG